MLNPKVRKMPKQNICKIQRPGKRQNKIFVKFRGPGNTKTNDGGLSAARETPKQTAADFPRPGKRQNKWRDGKTKTVLDHLQAFHTPKGVVLAD